MQNEIYTPMEKVLIDGVTIYQEALNSKKKLVQALALDCLLLELEKEVGLVDGLPGEVQAL